VIVQGRSEPLDVGRKTAVVPAGLRRAVVARDGGCRFPGCGRPQSWCDTHHVRHWVDGGQTALDNLVLLCRRHHRLVHDRFGVEMIDGRARFLRPNGQPLEDRAPP
jgi:5-methylcytosine-specific restriction endonuclease McrA